MLIDVAIEFKKLKFFLDQRSNTQDQKSVILGSAGQHHRAKSNAYSKKKTDVHLGSPENSFQAGDSFLINQGNCIRQNILTKHTDEVQKLEQNVDASAAAGHKISNSGSLISNLKKLSELTGERKRYSKEFLLSLKDKKLSKKFSTSLEDFLKHQNGFASAETGAFLFSTILIKD